MDVEKRVKKVLAKQLKVNSFINNNSSFAVDLGMDSLDTVELVMSLEEEFDCEISDPVAENITTVQQAIDYVNKNVYNKTEINELIDNYVIFGHFSNWGKIKKKNVKVFIPMLKFNLDIEFTTPIILDEEPPFAGAELFKKLHTGIFKNKQFFRIFFDKSDCIKYLKSNGLTKGINQDITAGNSYLNYLTYTGEMGSNDIGAVMNNCKTGILGPVTLSSYLHEISLDIAARSIESCVLFKPSFENTNWFKQLNQSFGIQMDHFDITLLEDIKYGLEEVWDRNEIYKFIKENYTTNLTFTLDFGNMSNPNISPESICEDAPKKTNEINISLLNYISDFT